MAFPGTLNISYYKADTYEFRIYPKDSSGAPFDLASYSETPKFTISTSRGTAGVVNQIEGYAAISADKTYVLCAIQPGNGAVMTAGVTYVYDVEITKAATPYHQTHTLLTGSITVTDHITGAV